MHHAAISKYLNNLVEQDHRSIKSRTGPMIGFKTFASAATMIAGIELLHRIRKGSSHLESWASKAKLRPPYGVRSLPFNGGPHWHVRPSNPLLFAPQPPPPTTWGENQRGQ